MIPGFHPSDKQETTSSFNQISPILLHFYYRDIQEATPNLLHEVQDCLP